MKFETTSALNNHLHINNKNNIHNSTIDNNKLQKQ